MKIEILLARSHFPLICIKCGTNRERRKIVAVARNDLGPTTSGRRSVHKSSTDIRQTVISVH